MKTRSEVAEKLDNLSLSGERLHKALKSLEWVNKWLGNHPSTVKAILNVYNKVKVPLKIIDLGCGGGDLILRVAQSLKTAGAKFSITGIDGNCNTLEYAAEKCAGFPEIKFRQADILNPDFNLEECDILITSHFIYHFSEKELIRFIGKVLPVINRAFICSELERSRIASFLFKISSFFLPLSKLARQDGLLAISRSFTKKEWLSILNRATLSTFNLKRIPLFRLQIIIFPSNR